MLHSVSSLIRYISILYVICVYATCKCAIHGRTACKYTMMCNGVKATVAFVVQYVGAGPFSSQCVNHYQILVQSCEALPVHVLGQILLCIKYVKTLRKYLLILCLKVIRKFKQKYKYSARKSQTVCDNYDVNMYSLINSIAVHQKIDNTQNSKYIVNAVKSASYAKTLSPFSFFKLLISVKTDTKSYFFQILSQC